MSVGEAFVHPTDFPETAKAFHHAIQTGTSYQACDRVYAGRTASFVGTMLVVSLCAIDRDASSSGMACLLTSMKARRPKNGPDSWRSCKPF